MLRCFLDELFDDIEEQYGDENGGAEEHPEGEQDGSAAAMAEGGSDANADVTTFIISQVSRIGQWRQLE